MNYLNGDVPMGFGMALAENSAALMKFAALSEEKKREIIDGTHSVQSAKEMKQYISMVLK